MDFASPLATDYHLDNLVCDVLQSAERYHLKRDEIAKALSAGFFSISRARKGNASFIASPEDIRSDADASVRLVSDREDGAGPYTMDEDLASGADPMLMICALPPPPLKQAKKEFKHALMLCNALVTDVYQMMRTCEGIEVWTGSRAEENCPFTEACKLGGSVKQLSFDGEQTEEGNPDEELEKELTQLQNDNMDDKGSLRQRGSQATTNIGNKKTVSKKMPTSFGESDDFNYKVADLSTDEEDED